MIRGITFDKQLMTSEDFAHQTNYFYQGKMGVTKGCGVSLDVNGDLVIADGYFMVFGRQVANVGNTVIDVPVVQSGTLYSKLVFTINLALENTIDTFTQGYFEIVSDAAAYPTLIQQDLNNGGTKYQLEFCKFENTISGVTNLVDTRTTLSMNNTDSDMLDGKHASEFALASHNHAASNVTAGTLAGQVKANATAVQTLTTAQLRNIQASQTDLTAGTSALTTGDLYAVYE